MRTIVYWTTLSVLGMQFSVGQISSPSVVIANQGSKSAKLPQYVVYRHFLGWVAALDKNSRPGESDSYKFADPFAPHAGLTHADLDLIRREANSLEADLARQDAKASVIITAFRNRAKAAAQQNQPLPPAPAEIHWLQQQRTVILIQHFVSVRKSLSPDTVTKLDSYLAHAFAPHIGMGPVTKLKSNGIMGTGPTRLPDPQ